MFISGNLLLQNQAQTETLSSSCIYSPAKYSSSYDLDFKHATTWSRTMFCVLLLDRIDLSGPSLENASTLGGAAIFQSIPFVMFREYIVHDLSPVLRRFLDRLHKMLVWSCSEGPPGLLKLAHGCVTHGVLAGRLHPCGCDTLSYSCRYLQRSNSNASFHSPCTRSHFSFATR